MRASVCVLYEHVYVYKPVHTFLTDDNLSYIIWEWVWISIIWRDTVNHMCVINCSKDAEQNYRYALFVCLSHTRPLRFMVSMETNVGGGSGDSGETFYLPHFCYTDGADLIQSS